MRTVLLAAVLALSIPAAPARAQYTWSNSYASHIRFTHAAPTPDGGLVALAERAFQSKALVRIGADGSLTWTTMLSPGETSRDYIGVAAAGDGFVVACEDERVDGNPSADVCAAWYDAAGTFVRERRYPRAGYQSPTAIMPLPDGGLVIAGVSTAELMPVDEHRAFVMRLAASGDTLWTRTGEARRTFARSVAALPDGTIAVAGTQDAGETTGDRLAIATWGGDGTPGWSNTFNSATLQLTGEALVARDGVLHTCGVATRDGVGHAILLAFSATGELVWNNTIAQGDEGSWCHALVSTPTGFAAGGGFKRDGSPAHYLALTDAEGNSLNATGGTAGSITALVPTPGGFAAVGTMDGKGWAALRAAK